LQHCAEPLLAEPWILDVDATIKFLEGRPLRAATKSCKFNAPTPRTATNCGFLGYIDNRYARLR